MDHFLKALRHRKAAVRGLIDEELAKVEPDLLRLQTLKRLRLRFRDQISYIERQSRRGDMEAIPVVRRRSKPKLLVQPRW